MCDVYKPDAIGTGQPPIALRLAEAAHGRPLAIYTGAGLSKGSPTNLPDGPQLAQLCHNRLRDILRPDTLDCEDPSSLTSVSDAASAIAGTDLIRRTATTIADFKTADPNFSHELLALLLLEGVVVAITTNWDDCIERSAEKERVLTIISDQDRQQIEGPALLKVHGCATRPNTVLITTEDLNTPPLWVRNEVNSRLLDSHTVFVGIGDLAPYVRNRIREATEAVGLAGAIFVVTPYHSE